MKTNSQLNERIVDLERTLQLLASSVPKEHIPNPLKAGVMLMLDEAKDREKPIIHTLPVPEGTTSLKVKIDGPNYPLILEFDDEEETTNFFTEGGVYDGHCRKGKESGSREKVS